MKYIKFDNNTIHLTDKEYQIGDLVGDLKVVDDDYKPTKKELAQYIKDMNKLRDRIYGDYDYYPAGSD